MELSRRDALLALGAAGLATGGAVLTWETLGEEGTLSPRDRDRLLAVAEVLYPTELDGIDTFVETYTVGRIQNRPAYREGVGEALATLDDYARDWLETPWLDLTVDERDDLLSDMGVDAAESDPDGLDHERVRYYLVNELLYALYTSPTGGELVGIENPIGAPGGTASYQRPPPDGAVDARPLDPDGDVDG